MYPRVSVDPELCQVPCIHRDDVERARSGLADDAT